MASSGSPGRLALRNPVTAKAHQTVLQSAGLAEPSRQVVSPGADR